MDKLKITTDMFIKSINIAGQEVHFGDKLSVAIDDLSSTIVLQSLIGQKNKQSITVVLQKDDSKIIINEDKISNH